MPTLLCVNIILFIPIFILFGPPLPTFFFGGRGLEEMRSWDLFVQDSLFFINQVKFPFSYLGKFFFIFCHIFSFSFHFPLLSHQQNKKFNTFCCQQFRKRVFSSIFLLFFYFFLLPCFMFSVLIYIRIY